VFCCNCGTNLSDSSQFCPKCGRGSGAGAAPALAVADTQTERQVLRRLGMALFLLVIGGIAFKSGSNTVNRSHVSNQTTQPVPQSLLLTEAIGNTAFTVNADSYVYYKLAVPQNASNVKVQGHFTTTGNSGNDIVVYLLTENSFVNWQNGYSTPTLYYSGRVAQGSLDVSLPSDPATYYLVFSNIFSEVTAKAVQANVSLRCDRLQDHLPCANPASVLGRHLRPAHIGWPTILRSFRRNREVFVGSVTTILLLPLVSSSLHTNRE
jgi:hypothetical protein